MVKDLTFLFRVPFIHKTYKQWLDIVECRTYYNIRCRLYVRVFLRGLDIQKRPVYGVAGKLTLFSRVWAVWCWIYNDKEESHEQADT